MIVASEGLKTSEGELYTASSSTDSFGHSQLGGLAPKIANLITDNLGYKHHWAVSDYLQRSARHLASQTDINQAIALGKAAVNYAAEGKSGIMPIIERTNQSPYEWKVAIGDLKEIANKEKILPDDYISEDGFRITKKGVEYLSPLVEGENFPTFTNGIPKYESLDLHLRNI